MLGDFWETQSHVIAKVCLRDFRLGNSLQGQGNHNQSVPPQWQAGAVLKSWETQGHTFARLCRSETFGKSVGVILRLLCQSMHLRCQVGHLWETQTHSIARVCLRGARFGNIWEGQSLNIARVCLQDVRLGSFLETQARSIPERVSEMPG